MAQPVIMVQQLDANNDPIEGPNGVVWLNDIDAVAQIIGTRLKLLRGEWWENTSIGFPLFQRLIGASGSQAGQIASQATIENTIRACPYVQQILSFTYLSNGNTRAQVFTCNVLTAFGALTVTNVPGNSAAVTT